MPHLQLGEVIGAPAGEVVWRVPTPSLSAGPHLLGPSILRDGFDSPTESLRTLFPGARLGYCLRHAPRRPGPDALGPSATCRPSTPLQPRRPIDLRSTLTLRVAASFGVLSPPWK
jgi:hypothetical protein